MDGPREHARPGEVAQRRRRLYQRSASEADVGRYRAAVAEQSPAAPVAVRPDRRRIRARLVVPGLIVVGALLGVLLIGAVRSTPQREPAASTRPAPSAARVVAGPAEPLGLATTLTHHGASFTGIGPGTIPIDRSSLSFHGGRVRVALLTTSSGATEWRLDRIDTRADWSNYEHTLARGRGIEEPSAPTSVIVAYVGAPPMTVHVLAAPDARWRLDLRFSS